MKFHNANEFPLSFKIAELQFDVPAGAECDIPGPYVYVVKSRGLKLTPGPAGAGAPSVEATAALPPEQPPIPPGVEVGGTMPSPGEGDEDSGGEGEEPAEESPEVEAAAAELEAGGVSLPGKRRRR